MSHMPADLIAMRPHPPTRIESQGGPAGVFFNAEDLMATSFPEPKWAVPGLIPEGFTLLVGAPKFGKSWLCLGLAVAVAAGGKALGSIDVDAGRVLYAALEDPPRRLQNRLDTVLKGEPVPPLLNFLVSIPRGNEGVALLDEYLTAYPDTRLIIIDVLRKFTQAQGSSKNAYEADYQDAGALKALADRHGVAIVAVHHTRKMADDGDVFNEVSGSTGLTGAADAILVAKRARNTQEAVLHITGRDVQEHEYGMTWVPEGCAWNISEQPAVATSMGATRRAILEHLTKSPGDTPQAISTATGLNFNTVRSNCRRMVSDAQLDTDGAGRYFPVHTPATPATGATQGASHEAELHELHELHPLQEQMS